MPSDTHPSGYQILIAWANDQDHWIRSIVSEIMSARGDLSEQSIDDAYELFLAEKGLSKDTVSTVPALSVGVGLTDATEDLRLVRLARLSGVNALASGQEIAFNPKLTVLFGENAVGKTGYVRVLKCIASARSSQPILGDINSALPGKPRATIDYTLAGDAKSFDWNDGVEVAPLARISVFDSAAVSIHVDDNLTYIFTPGELALFQYVHRAIEGVKARLERENNDAQPKSTNPFLHHFRRDAVIYSKIETLGAATAMLELDALAVVTREEELSLATIKERVDALQSGAADNDLHVAISDGDLYSSLRGAAELASAFPWEKYNESIEDVRKTNERYAAASRVAFAGEDIPNIFGEAWQKFITAGEMYRRETEMHVQSQTGDRCQYCRQDLDVGALALVHKYRDFCNNEPKQALDAAAEALRQLAAPIVGRSLGALKQSCERRQAVFATPAIAPPLFFQAVDFLEQFEAIQAHVVANRPIVAGDAFSSAAASLAYDANEAALGAECTIADLRKRADERKTELEKERAKLWFLENRLTLKGLIQDVRVYVERAQWASRARPLLNRITAILRALTEQSKLASQELLDKDFERLFDAECAALRAPKVRLDFAGRKGQASRKKVLVPNHRLSEILSEGEQKVIALADFLAEAGLRRAAAPVVLDDPVNSLDHRRIREIARRIVGLSSVRQVILFTHNILLVMEIVSLLENTPSDFSYFSVEEIDGIVGIVTSGERPRLDSLADLKSKINRLVQDAASQTGETRAALIEKAYEVLRAWIEVFIQTELLAGVVERFSPHVRVTALGNIKHDRLEAADSVIGPLYEKACRFIASHSQPAVTLGVRPTLEDLKKDWQSAQDARKAHGAK